MLRYDGTRHIFVYDTRLGLWHREDEVRAMGWAAVGDTLYLLDNTGGIWDVSGRSGELEEPLEWLTEFADFTEGSPDAKGYSKVQVRITLEEPSWAEVSVKFDSEDRWRPVGNRMAASMRNYTGQRHKKILA